MPSLKTIIERNDSRWGRVFDLSIQATIFFSLLLFSLETLPGLSQRTIDWLELLNSAAEVCGHTFLAVPITVGGKIFTLLILLIGLGIVSVPAGLVASALSKARSMEE